MVSVIIALVWQRDSDCAALVLIHEQVNRVKFGLCRQYWRMLESRVTFERNVLENVSDKENNVIN